MEVVVLRITDKGKSNNGVEKSWPLQSAIVIAISTHLRTTHVLAMACFRNNVLCIFPIILLPLALEPVHGAISHRSSPPFACG
jgi:hypothetical protein